MNCAEIVKQYLIQNGYDGLCEEEEECGCKLDNLFPCSNDSSALKGIYERQ